jgi:hypothetical protein
VACHGPGDNHRMDIFCNLSISSSTWTATLEAFVAQHGAWVYALLF